MFDYVVKVVIGQQVNMFSIQQVVAEYIMGQSRMEPSIAARADRLRIEFRNLPEGKEKVLVILDDVWETVELKDIGLSPLPNGFKLLLTSRNENICKHIAIEANLDLKVVRVDVMEEPEAQNFFWQIIGVLNQHDVIQIGIDIVRRCGFLPLAIKLIATTLKSQEVFAWRNALQRLKNNLDKNVQEVIEISYEYIKEEEEKAIFLLCGLFPDDFNIPIEELTRYAWGLRLLSDVSTFGDARDRTKTCIQNLKSANLLMDSDYIGCVKMHDLVLAFVLGRVSKCDHPWIINHGDISKWGTSGMSESCKRISITCSDMSEFQGDFPYQNVSLLRLMHGDKLLNFPKDLYEKMENLEVIAYEKMQYPLLPRSLQCSTKLRTLLLHRCLLMFDCSAIGELLNLEVLSFAHCGIKNLPSTIGKLKQLKLLDLTGCVNLRIDDGVLKNLVKLEELYMRAVNGKAICLTNGNLDELAELLEHLSTLEVEFFHNINDMPKNMLFTKLERFRISIGRGLKENSVLKMHSFENTLMLVTNKDELLECGINELFKKTEKLYLEVDDMNELEDVVVEFIHLPQQSFNNLRILKVVKCADLKYLFTAPMTSSLMKLERLTVSQCPVLEVLIYNEDGRAGVIKFRELKFLSLEELPNFLGFCNTVTIIELPQLVEMSLGGLSNITSIYAENTSVTSTMSNDIYAIQSFFNKEVLIPKLEILNVQNMYNMKKIWPDQVSSSDKVNACMLREIEVKKCDNIVNLFPKYPMSLLSHLEELYVFDCGSIEVLFDIEISCVGEIEEYTSNLRNIQVSNLRKLRGLWRIKGESSFDILIRSFQTVERIEIRGCKSFVNVFTPNFTNSDVRTLMNVSIDGRGHGEESGRNIELDQKSQEINSISQSKISEEVYGESSIHPIPIFHHLKELDVRGCKDIYVVFEIEKSSGSSRELTTTTRPNHQPRLLLPYLKDLDLHGIERLTHVWKCNWKKLLIPQNQSQFSFHNLTTIRMRECNSIKYLFSPLMGKLLPNLKEIRIEKCDGIEEVVSNRYDEILATSISTRTDTISFPYLELLFLDSLRCLKSIDGSNARGGSRSTAFTTSSIHEKFKCSQVDVASWFLSQHSKKIEIDDCDALSRVFPSYVVGRLHKLEELCISGCKSMVEVFESEGVNHDDVHSSNNVGDGSDDTCTTMPIPRSKNTTLMLELPNLTTLYIHKCEVLEYIFTSSTLESLKKLKELTIKECKAMQVIVKEDGEQTETSRTIVFPRLKLLILEDLPILKGFFLGMIGFKWPLLEKVEMFGCPQMMVFTSGHSMTPKLNHIRTGLGKHSLECGLNFHLTNFTQETDRFGLCSTPNLIKLLQSPWSFSNLVEVDSHEYSDPLMKSRILFPSSELLNLKNLEKLYIFYEYVEANLEEVFEVEEGTNDDDVNETQFVVVIPKLREVAWLVGSLIQLQELQISRCTNMDVIVKHVEDSETSATEIVLPSLNSITLEKLPNLRLPGVGTIVVERRSEVDKEDGVVVDETPPPHNAVVGRVV